MLISDAETRIFVVDDDDGVRDSLMVLLEAHGMQVEAYASTESFVASYRPHARACLILDQHLGAASGLEFLTSAESDAIRVPVILVTGRGDDALRARALEAGAAAYLEKPLDETHLVAAIDAAIANAE